MLDCDAIKGLVYKAESRDGKIYVGCTTQPLAVRISQHIAVAWNSRKVQRRPKWLQALSDNIHDLDWLQWSMMHTHLRDHPPRPLT